MAPVVRLHESVDEPVPVIRRLSHHTGDVVLIRRSLRQHRGQMGGEALWRDHLGLRIEEDDHTVVCLEINPAVEWHR